MNIQSPLGTRSGSGVPMTMAWDEVPEPLVHATMDTLSRIQAEQESPSLPEQGPVADLVRQFDLQNIDREFGPYGPWTFQAF